MTSANNHTSRRDAVGVPPAIVTMGESMCVLQPLHVGPLRHNKSMQLTVGGAESNVAIGARRLGVTTAWIGRVGADPMGELVVRELRAEDVDLSCVRVDPAAPTGIMVKERRTSDVSRVFYVRSGSAGSRLAPEDVRPDLIQQARVLHVTGITPALSETARAAVHHAIDLARAADVLVSFDLNHRVALWRTDEAVAEYRALTALADIVFASHEEAQMLAGDVDAAECATELGRLGPGQVVIKQGALGYTALVDGRLHSAPAHVVPVVDPVGAGDAFVAGYLAGIVGGESPESALQVANTLGAFAVSVPGDWEGSPSVAELALLNTPDGAVLR